MQNDHPHPIPPNYLTPCLYGICISWIVYEEGALEVNERNLALEEAAQIADCGCNNPFCERDEIAQKIRQLIISRDEAKDIAGKFRQAYEAEIDDAAKQRRDIFERLNNIHREWDELNETAAIGLGEALCKVFPEWEGEVQ